MAGTARAIYTSNGAIRQFSALGGTNADELQVEKISAITPTGSLTVALFGNLGVGDTLALGSTTALTQVLGNLQVDGDEVVNGDITLGDTSGDTLTVNATTTFNNNVTIGSTNADDLVVTSKVASGVVFKTSTGARSISTDGTNNLTIETATNGNLILQSAGTSSLSSATGTTIGATLGGVAITPTAGGVNINPTAGNVTVGTTGVGSTLGLTSVAGTTVGATAGGVTVNPTAGGVSITPVAGDVTITAPSTADLLLNSSGAGGTIALSSGAGGITANSGSTVILLATNSLATVNEVVTFRQDADGTPYSAGIFVGTGTPQGTVSGTIGDLYLEVGGGAPYYCTGTTNWTQVGSATGFSSLQQAYDTGNTIVMTADRSMTITTHDVATDESNLLVRKTDAANSVYLLTDTANDQIHVGNAAGTTPIDVMIDGAVAFNDSVYDSIDFFNAGGTATHAISVAGTEELLLSQGGTGPLNLTAAGGDMTLTAQNNDITLTTAGGAGAGNVMLYAGASGTVTMQAGAGPYGITINQTDAITGAGDIWLDSGTGAGGYVSLRSGSTEIAQILTGAIADLSVTGHEARTASLYLSNSGSTDTIGNLWIKQIQGTDASWLRVLTTADLPATATLQSAYNAGATITTASTTPIAFTLTSGGFDVRPQAAGNFRVWNGTNNYILVDGNTGETTVSGIAQDLNLTTVTSGSVVVAPISGGSITLDAAGAGVISLDAAAASNFTVAGANLTLATTTSGNVVISTTTAGNINLTAGLTGNGSVNIDGTGTGNVSIDSPTAANFTTAAGTLTLSGGGGVTVTSTGGTLALNATGQTVNANSAAYNLTSTGAYTYTNSSAGTSFVTTGQEFDVTGGAIDFNSTAAITLNAQAASNFSTDTGNLTLESTAAAGGAILQATGASGTVTLTANGATAGKVTINSTGAAANEVEINGGAVDINGLHGHITLDAAATYDIALTVASDASSDITFQAHGGNVTNFNSATDPSISTDFPAASRNIVGALNYLLTEAGGATAAVTSGEAYAIGDALYIKLADGRAYRCDADTEAESAFIGFAKDAATAAGESRTVYVSGECTVQTDLTLATGIDAAPGTVVFLDTTFGAIAKTAPSGGGDTVLKVGIVTVRGTGVGTGKVAIQVGTPVVL